MKFENTKVRVSMQVINIGQPERWNVIETNVILEEGDTFESCLDAAFKKVEAGHEKYSRSIVESQVAPQPRFLNVNTGKMEY